MTLQKSEPSTADEVSAPLIFSRNLLGEWGASLGDVPIPVEISVQVSARPGRQPFFIFCVWEDATEEIHAWREKLAPYGEWWISPVSNREIP